MNVTENRAPLRDSAAAPAPGRGWTAWAQRLVSGLHGLGQGLQDARTRLKLVRAASVGKGVVVKGRVWIRGRGRVHIGDGVVLDASAATIELHAVCPKAELTIGHRVRIASGTSIEAQESVTIGDDCVLGNFCKVMDNSFHRLVGDRFERPPSTPITIEDHVELGARSILLPGAKVEKGAIVCDGTVVTRRVPAGATVAGVSAVVVTASTK